ncbi:MAG: redox-regulated ATPase YchF [Candidatus Aenigmarchaeota archaeon]|nr:redox-regulated ATPase YchF [Candidatus Aenigmarchaeota archaeon]
MLIGVVGKPSAGKSTFFKACTMVDVGIANYPFTTIKPNHAVGYVRIPCVDAFFGKQCNPRFGSCEDHQRFVPVDLVDVAGLVPGAHRGEGMGLQFMNDLNQADALIHIVDASGSVDARGKAVMPLSYDPREDVRFLERELDYWYLEIIKRGWGTFARQAQMEKKDPVKAVAKQLSGLKVDEEMVAAAFRQLGLDGKPLTSWGEDDLLALAKELRQRSKPMLIAANKVDIPGAAGNVGKLQEAFPGSLIIPCSADGELALREAKKRALIRYLPGDGTFQLLEGVSDKQRQALEFIHQQVLAPFGSTGVQQVLNTAVFRLLQYKAIYPGGVHKLEDREGRTLPDCFLMPPQATALDFAFRLHTDFGNNFIKAVNVKTRMPVGKDHVLEDGDVIEIMARK